jgi:hypothetical protein
VADRRRKPLKPPPGALRSGHPEKFQTIDFGVLEERGRIGLDDVLRDEVDQAAFWFWISAPVIPARVRHEERIEQKRSQRQLRDAIKSLSRIENNRDIEGLVRYFTAYSAAERDPSRLEHASGQLEKIRKFLELGSTISDWVEWLRKAEQAFFEKTSRFSTYPVAHSGRPSYERFAKLVAELHDVYRKAGGRKKYTLVGSEFGGEAVEFILAAVNQIASADHFPYAERKLPTAARRRNAIGEILKRLPHGKKPKKRVQKK